MQNRVKPHEDHSNTSNLVLLHIAEYQTLTTRSTYWTTMQFSLAPVLFLVLALAAQAWNFIDHRVLVWGCTFAIQCLIITWYQVGLEIYNNVRYIERKLRPQLRALLNTNDAWKYESYLRDQRNPVFVWWEYPPAILSLTTLLIVALFRRSWTPFDYVALAATIISFASVVWLTYCLVKLRCNFFPPA